MSVFVHRIFRRPAVSTSNILAQLENALRISSAASDALNIPVVKGVLSIGLEILAVVKKVQDSQDRCNQLAQTCAKYIMAIYSALCLDHLQDHLRDPHSSLFLHITEFTSTLSGVHKAMVSLAQKNYTSRFFGQGGITDCLGRYTTEVQNSYNVFQLKLDIRTAVTVQEISSTLNGLVGANCSNIVEKHQNLDLAPLQRSTMMLGSDVPSSSGTVTTFEYAGTNALNSFLADLECINSHRGPHLQQSFGLSASPLTPIKITAEFISRPGTDPLGLKSSVFSSRNFAVVMTQFHNATFGANYEPFIQNVLVKATHLGYKKTVKGLARINARQHIFQDPTLGAVTVEEYFRQTYKIELVYPELPLVVVGSQNLLPPELCVIVDRAQDSSRPRSPKPKSRITRVEYRKRSPTIPSEDILRSELRIRLDRWAVLSIHEASQTNTLSDKTHEDLESSITTFMSACQANGIMIDKNPSTLVAVIPPRTADDLERSDAVGILRRVLAECRSGTGALPRFILVILPYHDKTIFRAIKDLGNVEGFVNQCVQSGKLRDERLGRSIFKTVVAKVGVKLTEMA